MTRATWIAACAAVLVPGALIAFYFASDIAREVLGFAAKGGERELREPMRPIRGQTRVLLVALDGVGDDTLREAVRAGRMPRLGAALGKESADGLYAQAFAVTDAMSILPSTTMAAWTSVYTGQPVATTGVAGNEWFVREERRFVAPGPVSVPDHKHTLQIYTEGLLNEAIRVPTLFEQVDVRVHVSLAPVFRGADLLTVPAATDVAELFGRLARGAVVDDPVDRKPYAALDDAAADRAIEAFERHGVPDLQVVYFPGIDLYGHVAEQPLQALERYLEEIIDPALGRILDAYARRGLLEDTYFVITSDHGHTPVLKHEHHALGAGTEGEPPDVLQKSGYRVRAFKLDLDEDEEDFQAVLAYQGAIAYVYLADRSTCANPGERCDWTRPPRLEEDVMPVVRAFYQTNRTGEPVAQMRDTLDLVFARAPRALDEPALDFQVFDGERLVPVGEHLAAHPRPDLILLEERLRDLAAGPHGHRAGDVLLLARTGQHRPIDERFYFSGLYHSWHGGAHREDSNVPLLVARAGATGEQLRDLIVPIVGERPSQLHVVTLVRALLAR